MALDIDLVCRRQLRQFNVLVSCQAHHESLSVLRLIGRQLKDGAGNPTRAKKSEMLRFNKVKTLSCTVFIVCFITWNTMPYNDLLHELRLYQIGFNGLQSWYWAKDTLLDGTMKELGSEKITSFFSLQILKNLL